MYADYVYAVAMYAVDVLCVRSRCVRSRCVRSICVGSRYVAVDVASRRINIYLQRCSIRNNIPVTLSGLCLGLRQQFWN